MGKKVNNEAGLKHALLNETVNNELELTNTTKLDR